MTVIQQQHRVSGPDRAIDVRSWLALAALGFVWGVPYLLIKIAVHGISAFDVAWCDVAFGAAVLLPIAALRGELGSQRQHWRAILALALLQFAVPDLLIAVSERWIPSSLAGTLSAAVPLLIVPLAPVLGVRETLGVRRLAGLLVGFVGVVVLLGWHVPNGRYGWAGIGCMLGAALAYAAAPLIIQRNFQGIPGIGPSAVSLTIATVVLLPAALWTLPSKPPSVSAIACLVTLGVVCTAMGLLLYFFLIQKVGAARASVVKYLNPAVAAVLGAVVLGESFPLSSLVGLLVILAGSWLAARRQSRTAASAPGVTISRTPLGPG